MIWFTVVICVVMMVGLKKVLKVAKYHDTKLKYVLKLVPLN